MQKGLETMVNGILGSDSLDGSMSSGYFEHVASSNDSNFSYHQQAATLLSDLQWAGAGKTAIPPNRSKPVVNNGIHFDSSSSFFSIQPVAPPGFESSNNGSQIGDHMIPPGLGFTMTDNWLSYDFTQRTQPATNSHHVGRVNSPPVSDTWSSLFTMPFDDMNDTTQYDPFGGNQSYPNLSFPASGLDGINQSSNRMTGRDVFGASRNFTSETLITQSHTEHTIMSTSASIKPAAVPAPALGGNRHGAGFFDTGQFFGDLNLNDDKQNSLLGSLED